MGMKVYIWEPPMVWLHGQFDGSLIGLRTSSIVTVEESVGGCHITLSNTVEFFLTETPEEVRKLMSPIVLGGG